MKTSFHILLIAMLFLLFSCESMVSEVEAPTTSPKIIVSSYLRAGADTIAVQLYYSRPLYTLTSWSYDGYSPVSDAIVKINNESSTTTLLFDPYLKSYYSTDMEVVGGKTYWLEVNTPKGEKVTAHCTVPAMAPPQAENITVDKNPGNFYEYSFGFRFADKAGKGDYYRVSAGFFNQWGPLPYEGYYETIWFQNGEEFVSDVNKDGEYFTYKSPWLYFTSENNRKINLLLFSTDEHYFNYHRSINNFEDDNPFAEPTPVYSNIEGGLGVFAGYQSFITEIDLNTIPGK